MRIVMQTVRRASVETEGQQVGALQGPAVLALVGLTHEDGEAEVRKLAEKTWGLRVLPGEKSCADLDAPILAVSQFTLYGDVRKGRRPSWSRAAPGSVAEPLFDRYVQILRDLGATVETGRFGAHMSVELVNDGPFTLVLDSAELL